MKLADKRLNIFASLKTVNPELKLLTYVDTDVLDDYYNGMYSESTLSPLAEKSTDETLARLLNGFYRIKWDNLIDGYTEGIKNLLTFGTTNDYSETRENTGENTNKQTNDIVAFDSDDYQNDSQSNTTNNSKENETIKHNSSQKNARNVSLVFNFLLRNNVISNIIDDVNRVTTLNIYEREGE